MKTAILGALSLGILTGTAAADGQYDRSIEAAAIRIVSAKMGDIRGTFAAEQRPVFVAAIDPAQPTWLGGRRTPEPYMLTLPDGRRAVRLSSF